MKSWPDDIRVGENPFVPAYTSIYQEEGGSLAGKLSSMVTSCALSVRAFRLSL
jgi:hypothetical protein